MASPVVLPSPLIPDEWLCESCRLRAAVRVVIFGGESFQVCDGCTTGARS